MSIDRVDLRGIPSVDKAVPFGDLKFRRDPQVAATDENGNPMGSVGTADAIGGLIDYALNGSK